MKWVAPLGLSTIALITTDRRTSGELFENGDDPQRLRISRDVSQFGSWYATGGFAAALYVSGRASHNARAREAGLLSAEALINGSVVSGVLKLASQRPRPPVDDASGEFYDGGSSFPSGHAISIWSVTTVVAQEYGQHRPVLRYGLYGLATAVSLSRYTGENHFLSDVLAGSVMGYCIGRFVYKQHHDVALDSPSHKQTSSFLPARFIPSISPFYNPHSRIGGAELSWQF